MPIPWPIRHWSGALALVTLGVLSFSNTDVGAGNTTCAGNMTDWYTNAVGETACETYQRLRQICNQEYQVPNFRSKAPGDGCDDRLMDCCCNSVSWALSMLCLNCQWDIQGNSGDGINAAKGSYQLYRNSSGYYCDPGTNQSLPSDIQTAVCNSGIKLDDFLYEIFWPNGSWLFMYTAEYAGERQIQHNNNTFTYCNSTTSTTPSASTDFASQMSSVVTASPSTITSSSTSSHLNATSVRVVGGVVGSLSGLALVIGTGLVCWRRRNNQRQLSPPRSNQNVASMSSVEPYTFTGLVPAVQRAVGTTKRAGYPLPHVTSSSDPEPSSNAGASYPSQDALIRDEDMGPVPTLHDPISGRLPPAYNPEWESPTRPQARGRHLPQPAITNTIPPPNLQLS